MLRAVYILTIKRPVGNPTSISTVYKAFGENIPRYLSLEGGDYKGPEYMLCIDRGINVKEICDKYDYICKNSRTYEVDESKFNKEYQIIPTYYSSDIPYRLEKYTLSGYDSD
jgi:hypothetical protein